MIQHGTSIGEQGVNTALCGFCYPNGSGAGIVGHVQAAGPDGNRSALFQNKVPLAGSGDGIEHVTIEPDQIPKERIAMGHAFGGVFHGTSEALRLNGNGNVFRVFRTPAQHDQRHHQKVFHFNKGT